MGFNSGFKGLKTTCKGADYTELAYTNI